MGSVRQRQLSDANINGPPVIGLEDLERIPADRADLSPASRRPLDLQIACFRGHSPSLDHGRGFAGLDRRGRPSRLSSLKECQSHRTLEISLEARWKLPRPANNSAKGDRLIGKINLDHQDAVGWIGHSGL